MQVNVDTIIGTAAEFVAENPVLVVGQLGMEKDTGVIKIGDGATNYLSLPTTPVPGGGGGSFPDFTGSGSPEGVITADVGKSYVDTANGGLWFKVRGTASTTGWACIGKDADEGFLSLLGDAGHNVVISDLNAAAGTGNGLYWVGNGADGAQQLVLDLGDAGQFAWNFNADGTTEFPGDLTRPGTTALLLRCSQGATLGDNNTRPGQGNGIYFIGSDTDGEQTAQVQLGPAGEFYTKFNADGTTEFPGNITTPTGVPLRLLGASDQGVVMSDVVGSDQSGNGLYWRAGSGDGNQQLDLVLGPSGNSFHTRFNSDGTTEFPSFVTVSNNMTIDGDVIFGSGEGPVVTDDADGHTYRIGSHNGAVTLTQVD